MARHPTRNRVMAGAFLLAMAVAAVAILVVVGQWRNWFEPKQTLLIRFDAAPNIKVGSPVLLAGHPVGSVADIQLQPVRRAIKQQTEVDSYVVEVAAELPRRYKIYQNARVTITQTLVGQSALINIENVGYGDLVEEHVNGEQESPFAGAADELGIGEEEKKDVSEILENIRVVTTDVRKQLPDILAKLKTTSANLVEVSEKAKGTIKRVDTVLDDNRENLKATVANARDLTAAAKKEAATILENLKDTTAKVGEIVDENRPDIRETIKHAKSVMAKADSSADEILANVKAASAGLKAGIEDFKVVAANAKALVETNRKRIARTMQNFHETSDHLKALAKEVRRAPWRLFAAPDKEEVESLNLYDVARAFAATASDLDSVADTLQAMMEAKAKGFEVPKDVFDEMLKRLQETYDQYGKAESALLEEFERIQK
jgi:ABC-type transporter Mla subunit MlaD